MLQLTTRINGAILWANLHLLFWLSIVSFTTAWMGENHLLSCPRRSADACSLARQSPTRFFSKRSSRNRTRLSTQAAVGNDLKGKVSGLLYAIAIPLAFVNHKGIAEAISLPSR